MPFLMKAEVFADKAFIRKGMARQAAYTGQVITWEMAMNSQEDLTPPAYDWDVKLAMPPVAVPGVTKFV